MYNLIYKVNNRIIETILFNKSKTLCNWKRRTLLNESNNYTTGKLLIVKN